MTRLPRSGFALPSVSPAQQGTPGVRTPWLLRGGMAGLALALAGCAGPGWRPLPAGTPKAELLARWGAPTDTRPAAQTDARPGEVLEYASGPQGQTTWMARLDAQGRLLALEQVLTEANFARVAPGMTQAQVRALLGRPAEVRQITFRPETVWAYRFPTLECRWFVVGFLPDGTVRNSLYLPDPACEVLGDEVRG